MAIKKTNASIYSTVERETKEKLARVASKNHRTMSKEIAYIVDLYLKSFDDDGNKKTEKLDTDRPT